MKSYVLGCFLFSLCLTSLDTNAQFLQDSNNMPVKEKRYVDISGSPYFNVTFLQGSVQLADNKKYDNLYLQYDQVQDLLLFKENKDDEFAKKFTVPVSAFNIDLGGGSIANFKNVTNSDERIDGFYQVIYDGKMSLLKRTRKKVVEKATYGTANKEKGISESTGYLLLNSDLKTFNIKPDKKSFLTALSNKAKDVEAYIASKKVDFKNDLDLEKLMAYYNTL